MARSARWPSASARARWRWCSPRSACSSAARRATRSASTGGSSRASRRRTSSWRSSRRIGVGGGTGHVFEFTGEAIRGLSMEERMTICNMSIEGGARAGLIAPDDTTFEYVAGRPHAPKGADWDAAVARWRTLPSDRGRDPFEVDDDRRVRARADDHLRHEPGHGHADHRACPGPGCSRTPPAVAPSSTRSTTWACSRASACSASRSTSSSSARAPTAGSATCARRRRSCAGRTRGGRTARHGRAGFAAGEGTGRARGPRPCLPRGRRRVARGRLLDVHRHERRPG